MRGGDLRVNLTSLLILESTFLVPKKNIAIQKNICLLLTSEHFHQSHKEIEAWNVYYHNSLVFRQVLKQSKLLICYFSLNLQPETEVPSSIPTATICNPMTYNSGLIPDRISIKGPERANVSNVFTST